MINMKKLNRNSLRRLLREILSESAAAGSLAVGRQRKQKALDALDRLTGSQADKELVRQAMK